MLDTRSRPEDLVLREPIIAWRAWSLSARRDGARVRLLPIAGSARPWPPLRAAQGSCTRHPRHTAPVLDCTCGLHAVHDPDLLRRARDPAVIGTVALWGRIVEHAFGYRGEFAYPQRARLVCYLCFWRHGIRSGEPDLVARVRRGRLVPLCEEHVELSNRCGYRTPHLVAAGEIEQALRSEYAVDPLPA